MKVEILTAYLSSHVISKDMLLLNISGQSRVEPS